MANKILQNIVGGSRKSDIAKVCKAFSLNMYQESQDASQASSPSIMRSIKGTVLKASIQCDGGCRGLFRASRGENGSPILFAAYGNAVYLVQDIDGVLTPYKIGEISNAATMVHFAETNGYGDAAPHLIVVDGYRVYACNTTLSPAAMALDWKSISLPKKAGTTDELIRPTHCAYLYGYLVVNDADSDAFYLSYQYPFETEYEGHTDYDIFLTEERWGYAGKGFAVFSEWMPDNTLAIVSNGSYLWTFGSRSYQCFSYQNDTNYPFVSPNSAASAIGLRATNSVASIGGSVFWLGSSDIGQNGIYIGEGTSCNRISTSDIEREIAKMESPDDAIGQCWQENHHIFYSITFIHDKVTYVYDLTEGVWHNRSSFNFGYWRPQFATFYNNSIYFGDIGSGALVCEAEKWTEWDGLLIQRKRVGGVAYSDYSTFFIDCLRLIVNSGQIEDPNKTPLVAIKSTWDGSTWTDYELGCIGSSGNYDWDVDFWHLGCGKYFSVEILFTEDMDFTIISAKINAEGANIF